MSALSFVTSPPGFAPLTDFSLDKIDGSEGLYSLHATAAPGTRMFVVDAGVHMTDYRPVIPTEQCTALDLTAPEDAFVLVVVNPAKGGTTANLMAPIIVNAGTGACAQVILDGQDWPLRAPLGARAA